VEDGVNGFWAANGDQWEHHLLELMKDEAMRKKMGLKGRERVEAEFSLEVNVPRLLGVLRKVLS
jgi:glycosyltransferase involved in cell wall biosynthesis